MKHYGPKSITLNQVNNSYESIVSNTHFIPPKGKNQIDTSLLKDIKPISPDMIPLLMILGLTGLNFISKVLRFSEYNWLTSQEQWEAYCLCDGFGKKTPAELKEINEGWDWSHVRDSSPEALLEAENYIKSRLVSLYNLS